KAKGFSRCRPAQYRHGQTEQQSLAEYVFPGSPGEGRCRLCRGEHSRIQESGRELVYLVSEASISHVGNRCRCTKRRQACLLSRPQPATTQASGQDEW